jgi:RNA 3'-terminal phosphate cyclase-like protein
MEGVDKKNRVYEGCAFFRQRLVLATLCGRVIKIKNIRSKDENPGLRGR